MPSLTCRRPSHRRFDARSIQPRRVNAQENNQVIAGNAQAAKPSEATSTTVWLALAALALQRCGVTEIAVKDAELSVAVEHLLPELLVSYDTETTVLTVALGAPKGKALH